MNMQFYGKCKLPLLVAMALLSQLVFSSSLNAAAKTLDPQNDATYNFSLMSEPSDNVILGKVKSLSARWVGKVIVTTADIEPIEVLKGSRLKRQLKVSYIGGTVGVIQQNLTHQIVLQQGETAILFLANAPKQSPLAGTQVFSHASGKISLLKDGENTARLTTNQRLVNLINNVRNAVR